MRKEKIFVIGESGFLLVYLGDYQVEVINDQLKDGSVLFNKDHWEDISGKKLSVSFPELILLGEACRELIEENIKGSSSLFNESSGSI